MLLLHLPQAEHTAPHVAAPQHEAAKVKSWTAGLASARMMLRMSRTYCSYTWHRQQRQRQ
jgi:hypothetical protein